MAYIEKPQVQNILCITQEGLTLGHRKMTLLHVPRDAEKTEYYLKAISQEHTNGQPFKSQVYCKVLWAHNSSAKGLTNTYC
jgi:hypothetical protein